MIKTSRQLKALIRNMSKSDIPTGDTITPAAINYLTGSHLMKF